MQAAAVSDLDPEIRLVVLNSLEARFDPYLASPECLRLLFMCLNDEAFSNRHAVPPPPPSHTRHRRPPAPSLTRLPLPPGGGPKRVARVPTVL